MLGATLRPEFVSLDDIPEPAAPEAAAAPVAEGDREDEFLRRMVAEFDAEVVVEDQPETAAPEGMPDEERKEG